MSIYKDSPELHEVLRTNPTIWKEFSAWRERPPVERKWKRVGDEVIALGAMPTSEGNPKLYWDLVELRESNDLHKLLKTNPQRWKEFLEWKQRFLTDDLKGAAGAARRILEYGAFPKPHSDQHGLNTLMRKYREDPEFLRILQTNPSIWKDFQAWKKASDLRRNSPGKPNPGEPELRD